MCKTLEDLARLAWSFAALDLAPREFTRHPNRFQGSLLDTDIQQNAHSIRTQTFRCGTWAENIYIYSRLKAQDFCSSFLAAPRPGSASRSITPSRRRLEFHHGIEPTHTLRVFHEHAFDFAEGLLVDFVDARTNREVYQVLLARSRLSRPFGYDQVHRTLEPFFHQENGALSLRRL